MTFRSLWGFLALSHMFQLGEGKEGDALEMHFFRLASKNKDLYSYLQDLLLLHCFQRPKLCIISNFSLLFFACHYKSSSRVWKVVKVHYLSCQTFPKYSKCIAYISQKSHFVIRFTKQDGNFQSTKREEYQKLQTFKIDKIEQT